MPTYNADDVIIKVQQFLNSHKGWNIDVGGRESYADLAEAIRLATTGDDKPVDFDNAIKYLLAQGWTFGSGIVFSDFESAVKFYRKEEAKRLRKLADELEEA